MWFKQAQPAISVGIWSSLFVKCPHAERSHDSKSSECTGKDLFSDLTKVVTNENGCRFTGCQHSFIYFAWKVISTHLKLIKEGFCHAVQYAIVVQTTIFILLQLFHAFFLTKFLLLHSEKSIHASIMNNCTGAFKQEKKNK